MKAPIKLLLLLLAIGSISLVITSCQKDDDQDTSAALDNALVESIFDNAQTISDQAAIKGELTTYVPGSGEELFSGCAVITLNTTVSPKQLTIDFGSVNCLCKDGRNRRGKIIVTFTGGYRDSGTVINHSFDQYFVNDHEVTGTKSVTNNGRNTDGNLSFTIDVDAEVIKPNNRGTISWKSLRTREWVEGEGTATWLDDVYHITGNASGITASGLNYTMDITKDLRKEIGFKHVVSGTLEFKPGKKALRIIDYGDGTRDNKATVEINGITFDIVLS